MTCCEECFNDLELKALIGGCASVVSTCDICGTKGVKTCDLSSHQGERIKSSINDLIDCYVPYNEKSHRACEKEAKTLPELLLEETVVFNLDLVQLRNLLSQLMPPDMMSVRYVSTVSLRKAENKLGACILPNGNWDNFVNSLKYESRFDFKLRFDVGVFRQAVIRCVREIDKGTRFCRSRKTEGSTIFTRCGMFPPPRERCVSGRLNPSGIRFLYLADKVETALAEVRPKVMERFCVAEFALKRKVRVLDLREVAKLSPFSGAVGPDFYLKNIKILRNIDKEFRRVTDGFNNDLEYLITQYVCDVIRQCGWAGVIYESTLNPNGENLALFDPSLAKMIPRSVNLYEIRKTTPEFARL